MNFKIAKSFEFMGESSGDFDDLFAVSNFSLVW